VPTVVHLAAEYWPVARTGGLGEAVAGLAGIQAARGVPVLVLLPFYGLARAVARDVVPLGAPFRVRLGSQFETGRWWSLDGERRAPQVLLLEHAGFFDRAGLYGEQGADYPDNARRFAFLSLAALCTLPHLARPPVVLHAHDWHAALAAVYRRAVLNGAYADRTATVLTVHNAGFQGRFPACTAADIGLGGPGAAGGEPDGFNFLKAGIAHTDVVTTVSPNHADELRTTLGGFGLHEDFIGLQDRLVGVLNGIDVRRWDPGTDPAIAARYSAGDLSGKQRCKAALQRETGLPERADVPLCAMSARMVEQKGLSLVLGGMLDRVEDAQFVFLGMGEARYEMQLRQRASAMPERVAYLPAFTDDLEHRVLAGGDVLLMPSLYEPCGLTQMRAQRYGTVPVVRRVGGLVDTVEDGVTGFQFEEYSVAALTAAVQRAAALYRDDAEWRSLMQRAMERDVGWDRAAAAYRAVYARAFDARGAARSAPAVGRRRATRRPAPASVALAKHREPAPIPRA
jgi:starch synthase